MRIGQASGGLTGISLAESKGSFRKIKAHQVLTARITTSRHRPRDKHSGAIERMENFGEVNHSGRLGGGLGNFLV